MGVGGGSSGEGVFAALHAGEGEPDAPASGAQRPANARATGAMVARTAVPPCCASCDAYITARQECAFLALPSLENRRRLLTMPCDAQQLLAKRLRHEGEDVGREAVLRWLDPDWSTDDVLHSFGRAPRDARLFLTSWAYLYLGRTAVRRELKERARLGRGLEAATDGAPPDLALAVSRALDVLGRIDAVGHAMLVDMLRDAFDAKSWRSALGVSDATVTDRKYMALYRYLVVFHGVLESVRPLGAAIALRARRFAPGEPTDAGALAATRSALGDPKMSMRSFRQLYREGATRSLELLGGSERVGALTMDELDTAFRRVLKLDAEETP